MTSNTHNNPIFNQCINLFFAVLDKKLTLPNASNKISGALHRLEDEQNTKEDFVLPHLIKEVRGLKLVLEIDSHFGSSDLFKFYVCDYQGKKFLSFTKSGLLLVDHNKLQKPKYTQAGQHIKVKDENHLLCDKIFSVPSDKGQTECWLTVSGKGQKSFVFFFDGF